MSLIDISQILTAIDAALSDAKPEQALTTISVTVGDGDTDKAIRALQEVLGGTIGRLGELNIPVGGTAISPDQSRGKLWIETYDVAGLRGEIGNHR